MRLVVYLLRFDVTRQSLEVTAVLDFISYCRTAYSLFGSSTAVDL
jgi:hypothetical protein